MGFLPKGPWALDTDRKHHIEDCGDLKGQEVWVGLPGGQGWGPSEQETHPHQGSPLEPWLHLHLLLPRPNGAPLTHSH